MEKPLVPAPLPIQSVNHASYVTRSLDESIHFYRDILGFREVKRPNFDFRGSWLFNYGIMIHLIENTSTPESSEELQSRANHIALHSDDMDAVAATLAEHGLEYLDKRVADTTIRQIFFQDPDGNHIEVGCYPATPPFLDEQ
jgi:catechol 2,3-dioxygenase-like lactoylglutathione lyase family enzyme